MTICGIVIKEDKTWEVLKQKYIPRLQDINMGEK